MSSTHLKTKNVFIDTSIFVSENFAVDSTKFHTLMSLAQINHIKLLLTDITLQEIESNKDEFITQAEQSLGRFQKNAKILRNLPDHPMAAIFKPFDRKEISKEIQNTLDKFLKDAKSEVIPALSEDPKIIFDKYFKGAPPFGKGKKKSEFPDAFIMTALEKWCEKNSQTIYVLSSDPDMEAACNASSSLFYLPGLVDFLKLALSAFQSLVQFAQKVFENNKDEVINQISRKLEGWWVWLEDQEGDGTILSVDDVTLDEESTISISENRATVELYVTASFEANITYDDLDTAAYDSEDKVLIPWRKIERDVQREIELPIEVSFRFSKDNKDYFNIEEIVINNDESFSIYADEDIKTFYK
jgi:hypothetical protein